MSRQTREYRWDFRGHLAFAATGAGLPFVKTVTASSGTPAIGGLAGGGLAMTFTSNAQAENLCLSFGDVLSFNIDEIIRAWFIAKIPAVFDATTMLAFGLAGARHDTIDSVAQAAIFRVIGANSNVVVETDDGTTDLDDVPTGLTLTNSWRRFEINFAERITTIEPPSLSKGRKSNIGFYGANALGSLRRVASGTRFDMSAYAGGLQPFVQLQKTSNANQNSVHILEAGIEVNLPQ